MTRFNKKASSSKSISDAIKKNDPVTKYKGESVARIIPAVCLHKDAKSTEQLWKNGWFQI